MPQLIEHQTVSPVNIYLGENFSVFIEWDWFKFNKCLHDNKTGGIFHGNFYPNKDLTSMNFSNGGTRLRDEPNAGGSSVISEVLSFEVLHKCFKANLIKTEKKVTYFPVGGSMTDYVCEIYGTKVGVSVTRAMKYGRGEFTQKNAERLLNKKLKGVLQANKNSMENWNKQILHVWSINKDARDTLIKVYNNLSADVTANTVVLITTSKCADYIYGNDVKLKQEISLKKMVGAT